MLRSLLQRRGAAAHCRAYGALCYDYTFTRVLGTPAVSEPILLDLLSAWHTARTGAPGEVLQDVSIIKPKVRDGAFPKSKGELVVDVRARDADSNYIVEVQHRVEPLFPHRAVLYAAADIVNQHVENVAGSWLRPVHSLAFCDFDFAPGKVHLATYDNAWRSKAARAPDPARAIHSFTLQPARNSLEGLQQLGNPALAKEMAERLSFLFALLPHAPRLEDLAPSTPPLLRWASLVAHVGPLNVHRVPMEVRTKGVHLLLEMLHSTPDETEMERIKEEAETGQLQRALESALAEGEAKGKAKGMAEGMAEGEAKGKAEGKAEGMAEGEAKGKAKVRGIPPFSLSISLGAISHPPHPRTRRTRAPFTSSSSQWASQPHSSTR